MSIRYDKVTFLTVVTIHNRPVLFFVGRPKTNTDVPSKWEKLQHPDCKIANYPEQFKRCNPVRPEMVLEIRLIRTPNWNSSLYGQDCQRSRNLSTNPVFHQIRLHYSLSSSKSTQWMSLVPTKQMLEKRVLPNLI